MNDGQRVELRTTDGAGPRVASASGPVVPSTSPDLLHGRPCSRSGEVQGTTGPLADATRGPAPSVVRNSTRCPSFIVPLLRIRLTSPFLHHSLHSERSIVI